MPTVQANGFELNYQVAGEGHPVVLLHGDSASLGDWQWVMPSLAKTAHVHAVDLPGHGDSSKPEAPYSSSLFADTIIAFLDRLGVERATLVGHSLGGLVAARATLKAPDRVSGLCLVDSGGLGRVISPALLVEGAPGLGEVILGLAKTTVGGHQRVLARALLLFARWWRVPPEWLAEQRRLVTLPGFAEAVLRARRSALDGWGQRDVVSADLPQIHVPTLVVWGANDAVVPVHHAHAAAGALPKGRVEVFPTCGHVPQIESPNAFTEVLTTFLDRDVTVASA